VRGRQSDQHQVAWGLGSEGMVNICKLLINVVTVKEPKMLTGSNPKWEMVRLLRPYARNTQTQNHRRKGRT